VLYLVQHGEAVSKETDVDRPLSDQGAADVTQLAVFLAATGIRVEQIFHSGKTRTQQTADILASFIQKKMKIDKVSGINPNDPVDVFADKLDEMQLPVMIVGHLPFMAKLVSHLVLHHNDPALVAYKPGSVVCLEKDVNAAWSINWMLRPELFSKKNEC